MEDREIALVWTAADIIRGERTLTTERATAKLRLEALLEIILETQRPQLKMPAEFKCHYITLLYKTMRSRRPTVKAASTFTWHCDPAPLFLIL